MPLIHDVEDPQGGPGSAFLSTALSSKVRRRRRKKKTTTTAQQQQQQQGLIGEDLLDWKDENVETPATTTIKPSLKTTSKKKKKASPKNNDNAASAEPKPKRRKNATKNVTPSVMQTSPLPSTTGSSGLATAMTRPPPRVRHALAVDTRALDTEEGMAIFQSVRQQALSFLGSLEKRGAAPCILACSTQAQTAVGTTKSPRGNARGAMQATAIHKNALSVNDDSLLQSVPIRPPVNAKNVQNRKAVLVPKRLLAHDSWKLFGDLVEAVVKEDQVERPANSVMLHVPPLDVTILSNDISFLCDARGECHKRGLNRFWERTRPLFECNAIRSIEIVVAETGSVVLSNAVVKDKDKDGCADDGEHKEEEKEEDGTTLPNHKVASTQCIQSIKAGLSTRAEADYKKTRSSEDPPTSVVVNFSTIPNERLGYHIMEQKWLNELLALSRDKGIVSFELPENLDGMQCALSFEATYRVFPFRADSIAATGMMADLQLLTQTKFEVLQLMPLSVVDAKLIFGQPIEVCPKLESDLAQYKEMKILCGSVLRYLSENEVALLLRGTDIGNVESLELGNRLYHTDAQTYLLMAEDLPSLSRNMASQSQSEPNANRNLLATGTLVRYAIAEQLLDSDCKTPFSLEGNADAMKELTEVAEGSLDSLERLDSNCVLDFALRREKESPSESRLPNDATAGGDASVSEDDPWTDHNGVGAVAQAKGKSPDDASDSSDSWSDFRYDLLD